MTLDTPHGPITKFLKKCSKNAGKMRGKIIFSPLWCLIQKLDHNSGLHAKNQREISKNEVRNPHPLYLKIDINMNSGNCLKTRILICSKMKSRTIKKLVLTP